MHAIGYHRATLPKVIKRGPGPSHLPTSQSSLHAPAPSSINTSAPSKLAGPPKIIQREIVGATQQARSLIVEAEERAQQILEEAQAQAEATCERGYQDGYQDGLGQYTEQTTKALLELQRKEAQLEPEFIKLVRVCVERILGQELKLDPDAIIAIVRNALQDARQQREIIVRAHPDDVESLKNKQGRLLEMLARANSIEIRADNAIRRGGCIVVTELGTIDASLDRQLTALENALEEELRDGDSNGPSGYDQNESELDQEDDPGSGGYGSF